MKLSHQSATRLDRQFEVPNPKPAAPFFLVYYDGGFASVAALSEACAQADRDTTVIAVYLDTVPYSEPLDSATPARTFEANAVLAAATVNARMRGINIQTKIVPCRVKGPALIHLAAQHGNAVIFLGIESGAEADKLDPFAEYVHAFAPSDLCLVAL